MTALTTWGIGTANAPMVTVGLGSSMRDLTTDEVMQLIRDLSRAYYEVLGALPPPVRRADIGAGSRTGPTRAAKARSKEGSRRWAEKRRANVSSR